MSYASHDDGRFFFGSIKDKRRSVMKTYIYVGVLCFE